MFTQSFERTGLRLGQFHNTEWALKERPYQIVVRGLGRRDKPGQEGEWIEDPETRGILTGLHYWRADRQKRPVDGWQYAWPIITTSTSGAVASGSGNRCAVGLKQGALPIFDESLAPDQRFQTFANSANRVPIGTTGIMLLGTNEDSQQNIPLWADRRLAAPHRFGASELGTPVHDLDNGGSYGVMARLQSAWFVSRPRGGKAKYSTNVLAWQMGPTGCKDDDGWGWSSVSRGLLCPVGSWARRGRASSRSARKRTGAPSTWRRCR